MHQILVTQIVQVLSEIAQLLSQKFQYYISIRSTNGFEFDQGSIRACSNYKPDHSAMNESMDYPTNHHLSINSAPSLASSTDGDSRYNFENANFSYAVFNYINDIFMEEEDPLLQDCSALQATEKSFYDVLGQKYPPSPNEYSHCFNPNGKSPDDDIVCSSGIDSNNSCAATNNASDKEVRYLSKGSRGRKIHQIDDSHCLDEGRNNKQLAPLLEEAEQSDMFDEVMIPKGWSYESVQCPLFEATRNRAASNLPCDVRIKGSNSRIMRMMKQDNTSEVVDLSSLLTQCAQAVASNDQRVANELLKQIRQHSSPNGDGTQRLAHYFANGLEARLCGTRTPYFSPSFISKTSVADILKAYVMYISASPFRRASNFLTNRMIGKTTEKATKVHVIDFGISYGFQWPCFIQRQSFRPGGPPKIRITGIELPEPGFRPAERVEETGHRLKKVAERCNVPFEYSAIARKWETIKLEDLKIDRDEVTIVTCMYRLNHLPDDTLVKSSLRDAILRLIKRINPYLFVHGVADGTYNSPFFVSRFNKAMFHFSALFDMLEAIVPNEDQGRLIYEREVFGRHAMNVIACEGLERTDNPETYKQWQSRNLRAGFTQLPVDQDLFRRVKKMVKMDYHKDFVVDENGQWMLQGWKGKIIYALSFWKPVQDS